MLDRKRRTVGRPRPPKPRKGYWQWSNTELVGAGLLWVLMTIFQFAAVVAIVWAIVEWGIPWVVGVVMDAVEQH